MFSECSSLKELNLTSFNTNNVWDMSRMFSWCSSLKELNLTNFNTNNVNNISHMFSGCSDDLKRKIKAENKNIKDEAFYDDY
jgi:surface protein